MEGLGRLGGNPTFGIAAETLYGSVEACRSCCDFNFSELFFVLSNTCRTVLLSVLQEPIHSLKQHVHHVRGLG